MGLADALISLPLRAVIAVLARGFLATESKPESLAVDVADDGTLHVLIVGAGLAMGYGVSSERRALPGQLESALSSRLGREVSVATHAQPFLDLRQTIEYLEPDGARDYDVVVFTPGFTEVTRAADLDWRKSAFELVAFLDRTGGDSVRIVLNGLPTSSSTGLLERIARRGIRAVNDALADVASTYRRAIYVPAPPFGTLRARSANFDERFYLRCADLIVDAIVPVLS